MLYDEVARGIVALPLYDAGSCRTILESVKRSDDWESATIRLQSDDGRFNSAPQSEVRSATILAEHHVTRLVPDFAGRMTTTIRPIIKQFWGIDLHEYSGTQIVRYLPGGRYLAHADAGQDMQDRYFSVVCYLNSDFEGGTTWFPNLCYRALPQCGKAIVFPSKYLHSAEPVLDGEKYVLVTWLVGPVPIKWI
jgi:hypothetical protein